MWARPAEVARPDTGTAGAAAQLKQLGGVVTSCSCTAQHSTAEAAVWRGYFLLLQLVSYQLWWACILPAVVWLLPVTSLAAVDSSWVAVFSSFAPCCFPFLP